MISDYSVFFAATFYLYLMCFLSPLSVCLSVCQGSDSELKVEKDVASDTETKVASGVSEVPVPADDTPEVLNKALSGLSSRCDYSLGENHPAEFTVMKVVSITVRLSILHVQ